MTVKISTAIMEQVNIKRGAQFCCVCQPGVTMATLSLASISKAYGSETILDQITFQLLPGEKAGLIGPNGSGKTTLLKIIAGELDADMGELHLARGAKTGYLPQEPRVIKSGTLRRHLEHPLRDLFSLRDQITALEKEIAASAEEKGCSPEKELERYSALTSRFEEEGGYLVESKLSGVARGLGFKESDMDRDIAEFSGGEKTRARLAGLLLQDLDLLLLDEPTNFLDLIALEWLEKYLRDLSCSLIVVSHDRFFLDRVVGQIIAFQGRNTKTYKGNYSAYLEQHALEQVTVEREYRRLKLLKDREERLVREAKADERSKRQARSRQKRLDKLDQPDLPGKQQTFSPDLVFSGRSGRQVVVSEKLSKTFEDKPLFSDLSFEIRWGDRIALIGPNGAGKSTLLKLICGQLEPTSGTLRLGPSVSITYFDQEQARLAPEHTLLEAITEASDLNLKEARNHLGRYLFRGDDVFKRVRELSGGEKSRLALARLALGSGNCLLMDEPTSHLDLPALEELERVLFNYPGTLLIVSHDRYFLKGLANRVFDLYDGRLNIYDLSFNEYLQRKESDLLQGNPAEEDKKVEKKRRHEEHKQRQAAQRALRRLQDDQARLEEEISAAEEEIERLEKVLSDPANYGDHVNLATLGSELEKSRSQLSALFEQWENVTASLDESPPAKP